MLDEKRIKEAKMNMQRYLAESLIKKESCKQIVFDTFMRNYRESLSLADHVLANNLSSLWVVVVSYYTMFYVANAVIYKLGYKVGSKIAHKVTADALIELARSKLKRSLLERYEEAKEEALMIAGAKADEILDSFEKEREKRSIFQYETTEEIKKSKAKTSFERAKEFCTEMERLLSNKNEKTD